MLCEYGCGKVGNYILKNGKICCSISCNSCIYVRNKNSDGSKISWQDKEKRLAKFKRMPSEWLSGKTIPKKVREKISLSLSGRSDIGRAKTVEKEEKRKHNISKAMRGNPKAGGYRHGSGRGKKQWYTSPIAGKVFLDSSYEVAYAEFLDLNKIEWTKNKIKFPYSWNGTTKYYIPDFYLKNWETYIEIKGYQTPKDICKWANFPYKLTVLFRDDLKKLGLKVV